MAQDNRATSMKDANFFQKLTQGFQSGFELSGEDRRDLLFELRERENKAEAPRPTTVLAQHPLVDMLRQAKTFGDGGWTKFIPFNELTDEAIAFRANNQLNIPVGEKQDLTLPRNRRPGESKQSWLKDNAEARAALAQELESYKAKVRAVPGATKAGYALGALTNDFTNNATRNFWWLINASQAIVDLGSEAVTAAVSPDLFSYKPLVHVDTKINQQQQQAYAAQQYGQLKDQGLLRYRDPGGQQFNSDFDDVNAELMKLKADGFEIDGTGSDAEVAARINAHRDEQRRANPKNYERAAPGVKNIKGQWKRRRFNPNAVGLAAMLPASLAVNAGIGLIGGKEDSGVPFVGRREGYQASVPDEEDARKTANAIAEVGNLYIMGREGKKMAYGDFVKERPDVSKADYNKYEAYERDRGWDLNPFDGDFNLGGVLKGTTEGIHGPEVMFLGKNLSLNETLVPTVGALVGTAVGGIAPNVRRLRARKKNQYLDLKNAEGRIYDDASLASPQYNKYTTPAAGPVTKFMGNIPEVANRTPDGYLDHTGAYLDQNDMAKAVEKFFQKKPKQGEYDKPGGPKETDAAFQQRLRQPPEFDKGKVYSALAGGGLGGLVLGQMMGSSIEQERRRREFEEDHKGLDYDAYVKTSRELADRKYELVKANPNRKDELASQGKTSFNSRAYQSALQEKAQDQQVLIDMMLDQELKKRAQAASTDSNEMLAKAAMIEREIEARKRGEDPDQQNFNALGF